MNTKKHNAGRSHVSALDRALDGRAAMRPRARPTWSFQPSDGVRSVVAKEMNRRDRRGGSKRGLRSKIINAVLGAYLLTLPDKRKSA